MVVSNGPPYRGIDWDDALEGAPRARALVTRGHARVELWLFTHAKARILSRTIVENIHRELFAPVYPEFAGRLRGPAPRYLPVNVHFGRYRGEPYEGVPDVCTALFVHVGELIRQLDGIRGEMPLDLFEEEVLKVASYVHCELVRIHPFRNGNGRTARICISYFAARYGMLAMPFDRPPGDYLEANAAWLRERRIEPFLAYARPYWNRRPPHP